MWFDRQAPCRAVPVEFTAVEPKSAQRIGLPPWLRGPKPAAANDSEDHRPPPTSPSPPMAEQADQLLARALEAGVSGPAVSYAPTPERTVPALPPPPPGPSKEQREALARMEEAIVELGVVRAAMASDLESQVVLLACNIARKVIHRELATDPDIVLALAREGIEALGEREHLRVSLGPIAGTETPADFLARVKDQLPNCEVVVDPNLPQGTCVVQGQLGQVDESIDERLDNVLRSVLAEQAG